jgi:hypothetical protein
MDSMTPEKIAAAAVSALLGAGVGWAGQALTVAGRVTALEVGQSRMENKIDVLLTRQVGEVPKARP